MMIMTRWMDRCWWTASMTVVEISLGHCVAIVVGVVFTMVAIGLLGLLIIVVVLFRRAL